MNLINTTAFHMAVRFAVLFVLIAVAALTSMYYFTMTAIAQQTDRELIHEIGELEAQYYQEGLQSLVELIQRRDMYGKHLHHFYALSNPNGELYAGNEALFLKVDSSIGDMGQIHFQSSDTTVHGMHADDILRIAVTKLDNGSAIIVGQEQNSLVELRTNTLYALFIAVIITVLLSLYGGSYMGRYAMRNISRIDEGLGISIKNDFNYLLPVPKDQNEYFALTEKLNLTLGRIHDLIASIRHVTDNVAHELRSPLTRMRNRLEVTLLQSRTNDEYQTAMEKAIEDCNDLLNIFNSLLKIAKAESGIRNEDWSHLELTDVLDEIAELYLAVAEDAGHEFFWEKPKEHFLVEGNRQLLAQTFSNILDNAIKYTPTNGKIRISITREENSAVVCICDNGIGIPEKDRKQVLERFHRLTQDNNVAGSGLGLSLVQAVAKLHHATLQLEDNQPGLCVKLVFKLIPAETN